MTATANPIPAYIGITGAICMAISDVILLGVPSAGWEGDIASFSSLPHVAMWRLHTGPLLGLVSSFFICFGFWHVKEKLSDLDPKLSMLMFISLSAYIVFGGAFHAANYFAGYAIQVGYPDLYHTYIRYLWAMLGISTPGLLLGSGLYFYLLIMKPNQFPTWLKWFNLLVLQGLFLSLFFILPAPVGGYLKPTFINMASLAFFIINLKVKELSL